MVKEREQAGDRKRIKKEQSWPPLLRGARAETERHIKAHIEIAENGTTREQGKRQKKEKEN